MKITCVIPALNEESTVGQVVRDFLESNTSSEYQLSVIVVDNGSLDSTAKVAREAGASVLYEADKGYGAACLKAFQALEGSDVVVFADADGSDNMKEWTKLVKPIIDDNYEFVLGSRVLGNPEPGSLGFHQAFGNKLATTLMRLFFGAKYTDLGPFRAIKTKALFALDMIDRSFGWTIEMQLKVKRKGFKYTEIPVDYRKRQGGNSKISGNFIASMQAGVKIISIIGRELCRSN